VEEVDQGAEDVDGAARVGAEEVEEREAPEVDGVEEVPRLPVDAPDLHGSQVVLRVLERQHSLEC
jgi:hypothetical protein